MVEELISRVFAARNAAHLEHWETRSYATHVALGEFYDAVIDALDTFIEARIAYHGRPKSVELDGQQPDDMAIYLSKEVEWIRQNRSNLAKGVPALENLIDALAEVYLRTIYKLTLS